MLYTILLLLLELQPLKPLFEQKLVDELFVMSLSIDQYLLIEYKFLIIKSLHLQYKIEAYKTMSMY